MLPVCMKVSIPWSSELRNVSRNVNCTICREITPRNFNPKSAGFTLGLQGKAVSILTHTVHMLNKKKWLQGHQVLELWLSRA